MKQTKTTIWVIPTEKKMSRKAIDSKQKEKEDRTFVREWRYRPH